MNFLCADKTSSCDTRAIHHDSALLVPINRSSAIVKNMLSIAARNGARNRYSELVTPCRYARPRNGKVCWTLLINYP